MNLSLVARNVGVRAPSALSARTYSRTSVSYSTQRGDQHTQPPKQNPEEVSQRIRRETESRMSSKLGSASSPAYGEWQASRASASEEIVKADRSGDVYKSYEEMQEKTKKLADDVKDSTESRVSSKLESASFHAPGEWQASRASASEEMVKADRGSDVFKSYKQMQEKTKKVAEELEGTTESLKDGLWRKVGGIR